MQIYFHVGMGKTGTSAIQKALQDNTASLTKSQFHYLGRNFGLISNEYSSPTAHNELIKLDGPNLKKAARQFLRALERIKTRKNVKSFIFSNESLFHHCNSLAPFFNVLMQSCDVKFVIYLRSPKSWLPSAYSQWRVRHKVTHGPMKSFESEAPILVNNYADIKPWLKRYKDNIIVKSYDAAENVVDDFCETVGLKTKLKQGGRFYQREAPSNIIFRTAFNNHFKEPIRPDVFEKNFKDAGEYSLTDLEKLCLDHSSIDKVIDDSKSLFKYIQKNTGINLLKNTPKKTKEHKNSEVLKDEIIGRLIQIAVLNRLEINKLQARLENSKPK